MRERIRIVLELSKLRIAILSTASTAMGYVLAARGMSAEALMPIVGVLLLACGASALNQVQERDVDALMERTRRRPIPTGRISTMGALLVSLAFLAAGSALLAPWPVAMLLGLFTVLWYNGVYTNLKRVSAFAAIPGGLVGAIPPAIGWVAGGGHALDPRILVVAFFFFIWQVPHFWLLLQRIGPDYERAGLPSLTAVFSRAQLTRVTFIWMITTAVACLLIPFFGVSSVTWIQVGFVAASVWLGWHAALMLRSGGATLAFKEINIYALMVISLLSLSGFVG